MDCKNVVLLKLNLHNKVCHFFCACIAGSFIINFNYGANLLKTANVFTKSMHVFFFSPISGKQMTNSEHSMLTSCLVSIKSYVNNINYWFIFCIYVNGLLCKCIWQLQYRICLLRKIIRFLRGALI